MTFTFLWRESNHWLEELKCSDGDEQRGRRPGEKAESQAEVQIAWDLEAEVTSES